MFLPAELICCSKLGAKLSFYYIRREGGIIFIMPRPAVIYIKSGAANSVLTAHAM
jgi:hypothetical protein